MSAPKAVESSFCWDIFTRCFGGKDDIEGDKITELAKKELEAKRKREDTPRAIRPTHRQHFSTDMMNVSDMVRWGNFLGDRQRDTTS